MKVKMALSAKLVLFETIAKNGNAEKLKFARSSFGILLKKKPL